MKSSAEIEAWVREHVAKMLKVPVETVDPEVSFDRIGLDSSSAVALVGDLEAWLGLEVDPVAPYTYPTVRSLSDYLSQS